MTDIKAKARNIHQLYKQLFAIFLIIFPSTGADGGTGSKLLVIMLDGFRWDYLGQFKTGELLGFERFRTNGVTAKCLVPSFPTLSYVNYYTLMTGLHPETHGMTDNYMYDGPHDESFRIGENTEQYHTHWWKDGEPLWITAGLQGKRSYFWYWPGCEVEIRGRRPTFYEPYQSDPDPSFENFTIALHSAVDVLRNGSADLAGVYFEKVDSAGHQYGPNSPQFKETIRRIDIEMVKIQDRLEMETDSSGNKLIDRLNLMIFSDHGMTERIGGPTDNVSGIINIMNYVNRSDYAHQMGSKADPVLQLWPHQGQEDTLYQKLRHAHPHLTVYKKADIPDRYFIKNHHRVPPIYLVADRGFVILSNKSTTEIRDVGFHGYDNQVPDMHGIFMVRGKDFKRNYQPPCVSNVHLYQLMCHVLGLNPATNNGSWSEVCMVLTSENACAGSKYQHIRPGYALLVLLLLTAYAV